MTVFQQQNVEHILLYLKDQLGLNFLGNSSAMIERRLQWRLSKTGQTSYIDYLSYLKANDGELPHLLDALTINVTRFFRDSFTFEFINNQVLPGLISEKDSAGDPSLRIWSAGCSSGEEPYSLAILLQEYYEKEKKPRQVSIFATDIDANAIQEARSGFYSAARLQDVKLKILQKYFINHGDQYELASMIRDQVKFSIFDMLSDETPVPEESIYGGFDLVLCRNLLIYFKTDFQEKIIGKLHQSLTKNGILVLGESERILGAYKSKFQEYTGLCRIYRKL